jgi:hypothetical protein
MWRNSVGLIGEPHRLENGLLEPNLEAYAPEGLCIAKTLIWNNQDIPMRVQILPIVTRSSRKVPTCHTVNQIWCWPYPIRNNHRSKTLLWTQRTWWQQPGQTWMMLNPGWKSSSLGTETSLEWRTAAVVYWFVNPTLAGHIIACLAVIA